MEKQIIFADIEYSNRKRRTRRDEFLTMMDKIMPWKKIAELIEPIYFKGERSRPLIGIEPMRRMYFLQIWFTLSDECVEDSIYVVFVKHLTRAWKNFMPALARY